MANDVVVARDASVFVPVALVEDPDVDPAAFRAYAAIASFLGLDPVAWPSNEQIAERMADSPETVARAIATLIDAGWLIAERDGHATMYTLRRLHKARGGSR